MNPCSMNNAVEVLWQLVPRFLTAGDSCVDATVGNGRDTAALCGLVGPEGHVYGFDIQQDALDRAAILLTDTVPQVPCTLIHASHADMRAYVEGPVALILFNLGYLPGGNKAITTQAESTLAALNAALGLLRPGGRVAVVLYPGHEAGARESAVVKAWASQLNQREHTVLAMSFMNQANHPPELILIEKRG